MSGATRGLIAKIFTVLAFCALALAGAPSGITAPVLAHASARALTAGPSTTNPFQYEFDGQGYPNCVWYAWQRLHDVLGIDMQGLNSYVNAGMPDNWIHMAQQPNAFWSERTSSYVTAQINTKPQRNDVMVAPVKAPNLVFEPSGHVAWVEAVVNGSFNVSEQSYNDTEAGRNTSPYPYTYHHSYNLAEYQAAELGQLRFIHFNLGAPISQVDDAKSVGQSSPLTVEPNQRFTIFFTKLNTGTSTWSDRDGFMLACVANCMGTASVGFNGSVIAPKAQRQFTITLTAPSSPGAYPTAWVMEHNAYQFGDATMFVAVTVAPFCSNGGASGLRSGLDGTYMAVPNLIPASSCGTPGPAVSPTPGQACGTPSLSSPSNGSSFAQNTSITLSWNTTCAQSYTELAGGPYGTLNFGGWQNRSSLEIGQLWPGAYTWHVNGMGSNGLQTGWSSGWTFIIQSTPVPAPTATPTPASPPSGTCSMPSLSSPSNNSSFAQSTSITLYWNTNCPQSYTELWGGPYGALNFGGWTARTSLTIGQMWPGTYTWHVNGMDGNGLQTGYSGTWTFTIQSAPAPTATPTPPPSAGCSRPSLSSPPNGASYPQSTSITLYWNTNCPQSYTELSGGPYGTLNFGGWTARTSLTIGQMWPGTYTWHVNGMDSSGRQTGYSSTWTFTIQ